jgi:hypothetical protein
MGRRSLQKLAVIKEMIILYIISNILDIALPSPLLLIRIATIALLCVAALLISVVYIQSIGSGTGIFSGLFCDVQGFNTGSIFQITTKRYEILFHIFSCYLEN